jgi:hypothetical protein
VCAGCGLSSRRVNSLAGAIKNVQPLSYGSDARLVVPLFDRYDAEAMENVRYVILREDDWEAIRHLAR